MSDDRKLLEQALGNIQHRFKESWPHIRHKIQQDQEQPYVVNNPERYNIDMIANLSNWCTFGGRVIGVSTGVIIHGARRFMFPGAPSLARKLSLAMECCIGYQVYCTSTMHLKREFLQKPMALLPWIPGRSNIAYAMCPTIELEYTKLPKEFWERNHDNPMAQTLRHLAEGCSTREDCEIFQKSTLRATSTDDKRYRYYYDGLPAMIPHPGVDAFKTHIQEEKAKKEKGKSNSSQDWAEYFVNNWDA